jgi:hypothetical protein
MSDFRLSRNCEINARFMAFWGVAEKYAGNLFPIYLALARRGWVKSACPFGGATVVAVARPHTASA